MYARIFYVVFMKICVVCMCACACMYAQFCVYVHT
jgi:hypothetical protein